MNLIGVNQYCKHAMKASWQNLIIEFFCEYRVFHINGMHNRYSFSYCCLAKFVIVLRPDLAFPSELGFCKIMDVYKTDWTYEVSKVSFTDLIRLLGKYAVFVAVSFLVFTTGRFD